MKPKVVGAPTESVGADTSRSDLDNKDFENRSKSSKLDSKGHIVP